MEEEGKNAIESPTSPTIPDIGPEGYLLGNVLLFYIHIYNMIPGFTVMKFVPKNHPIRVSYPTNTAF